MNRLLASTANAVAKVAVSNKTGNATPQEEAPYVYDSPAQLGWWDPFYH